MPINARARVCDVTHRPSARARRVNRYLESIKSVIVMCYKFGYYLVNKNICSKNVPIELLKCCL